MLETALVAGVPSALADELRRTLISVMEQLDEAEGVRDNCLIVAESALKRGETERGADYLLRAASASAPPTTVMSWPVTSLARGPRAWLRRAMRSETSSR